MDHRKHAERARERMKAYASGGAVSETTKEPKPLPIKPPLTPESPHWNPDSLDGRFPTRSPRP